ncbi:xanthine dehydrogenase family protein molybdopterin-binding subunit [Novosphingobium sp. 9U]|uniref:xanthine dehydrogenase family protein molybdopterin-binding subunit n=1 Tax=Novosphingobium sp. 9U TaxID=2653158 RepID=UPI0012F0F56E|nr:xanthine dehydrogenase family protein molybdopterin-binding subunit [Novosphingobium sp. 9U]VWX53974.1 Xanthine dehydrogenase, molybdenum binding subunit [Novosphingobium sp. 9U]
MNPIESARQAAQGLVQAAVEKAIQLAPASWVPGAWNDPVGRQQHGHVGQPVSRIDGPLKVRGAAKFAAEFAPENMAHAALTFATIARGRITAIDTSAAQGAPGVVLVMTHENAPRLKPMPLFMTAGKAGGGDDLPILQDAEVHYNGQPIALVLAETLEQAEHAASLIKATYEIDEAVTTLEAGKARGTHTGVVFGQPAHVEVGKPEDELAAARHRFEATYTTPRHNHNAIEPHAVTLYWRDGELHMHDAVQAVNHVAWSVGNVFGLDEDKVHVTSPYVGGGFGSKVLWSHQILAAAAARESGRPVRMNLSREGVYRTVGGRALTEQTVALGTDAEGRLQALQHTGTVIMSAHNALPEPFILSAQSSYATKSMLLDVQVATLDMLANTFMRAPGEAVGSFGLESAMDELAEQIGVDPVELRIRNEPEKDPMKGLPFSSREVVWCWRTGAERFGWDKRQAPGSRREGEWLVGLGCAMAGYPYQRMPGGAAGIKLTADGRAHVSVAAHEMGMGTSTVHTQILADRLALPMDAIEFSYGDNSLPGVVLAGGSQQTASVGSAIIVATRELVEELLQLAGNDSPLAGLSADEVGTTHGGLASLSDPQRYESYASILSRAGRFEISVVGQAPMPGEGMHWSMHSHGAVFVEARVNAVTGEVRVPRITGAYDCGRILNPKTATSQLRGGIIMGLGAALMEETQVDPRNGRIMNASLSEYHLPVHLDVPEIEVIFSDIPDPVSPMGARGIGEIGITGVSAAVANAVYNATGKRVRDLPITLDKLL